MSTNTKWLEMAIPCDSSRWCKVSCVCADLRQSDINITNMKEGAILTHAKVLDGLAGVPLTPQEQSVRSSRCPKRELVQGQDFTTSIQNPLLCTASESEGGNGELGEGSQADVVCDRADGYDDLALIGGTCRDLFGDGGKGDRRTVDFGHEEPLENDFVKACVRATGQETVQLQHM